MSPLGPILAATVFSAADRHAADRAARLARETGAALTLMHVMSGSGLLELRSWFGAGSDTEQHLQAEARRQLGQLASELHATRHVAVRQAHAAGAPLDEIVREAQAQCAGLLVVGPRGAGFLQRLVLGTTSERLLRRTTRPVLVARHTAHEPYRRVLPSDRGDKCRREGGSADGAKCALHAAQHLPGAFPGDAAFWRRRR
jgi:nucleotide-binding universal stress UspA family protein